MEGKKDGNFNQQQRPLFDALQKHQQREQFSFHVPGHKNGINWQNQPGLTEFSELLKWDQTEVAGLDYLHEAEGVLKDSQALLTELYQSQQSYYLVNGSTVGNLAMILALTAKGDTVLVDRNVHQSVIHALELNELRPIFLAPEIDAKRKAPAGISTATLQKAFADYPAAKGLILTYPTYHGTVYPIEKLIKVAHEHNCLALVDEAHGAHFILAKEEVRFPVSALAYGADVVVQSAHKMLPALTQGAYLHIGNGRLTKQQQRWLEHYLHMLQSSSPSYLLMLSLEYARWFLANLTAADIQASLEVVELWSDFLKDQGLTVLTCDDPLKLIVEYTGLNGAELSQIFEAAGLFPELATSEGILLTFPLLKEEQLMNFQPAASALVLPAITEEQQKQNSFFTIPTYSRISQLSLNYEQQQLSETELCLWRKCVGKIAAENITPYPPGVPLILKGEEIKTEHLEQLASWLSQAARVVGLDNEGKLAVYLVS